MRIGLFLFSLAAILQLYGLSWNEKKISLFISFSNENGLHARACSKTFKFRLLKQTDLETFLSIQLYLCIEKLLVHNCHVLYVLAKKKWKTFGFVEF